MLHLERIMLNINASGVKVKGWKRKESDRLHSKRGCKQVARNNHKLTKLIIKQAIGLQYNKLTKLKNEKLKLFHRRDANAKFHETIAVPVTHQHIYTV